MEKEFCTYEQSLALKELGFEEPCFGWFLLGGDGANSIFVPEKCYKQVIGLCLAPLKQQAFKFFRDKYDLFGCIDLQVCVPSHWYIRIDKIEINDYIYHSEDKNLKHDTYEEAEHACLDKLIEICKNK